VLDGRIRQAEQNKITQLQKIAITMRTYRKGILAWYDCHLSTGKVEGINNKTKVMKRNTYGFRDERNFTLRLYALHDYRITRNVE
jgi:transposase